MQPGTANSLTAGFPEETLVSENTYKASGVDLELYEQAMQRLPALMKRTHTPRVMPLADAFAGLFRLNASSIPEKRSYDDPVLVSGTDGVGTKIKVAQRVEKFNTVGIDLVAMSVNDCLCLGAEPLFFLDYLALGKDDPDLIAQLVEGVSDGCASCGAALMGGETAIMPDLYAPGDFDLAGFCVGVVERTKIVDGSAIRPGDVVIGLPSSGFHSNGYSLVRRVVFEQAGLAIDQHIEDLGTTVGAALLEPTILYVKPVLELISRFGVRTGISGLAHITGGGLIDNTVRILPEGVRLVFDRSSWTIPPLFRWLQELGKIDTEEMYKVFNMGIGFCVIVRPEIADSVVSDLQLKGISSAVIGAARAGTKGAEYGSFVNS